MPLWLKTSILLSTALAAMMNLAEGLAVVQCSEYRMAPGYCRGYL